MKGILILPMVNSAQLNSIFSFVTVYAKNPRVSTRELHKKYSHYANRGATRGLIQEARKEKILIGPSLYCNSGLDVLLLTGDSISDEEFNKYKKDPTLKYAVSFLGSHSLLCFKKGASILKYSEAVIPSFPAKKSIDDLNLEEKGELPVDPYPHGWDEFDWAVFNHMKNPLISFQKVGSKLNVSWTTIKNRYKKILKSCKIWIGFFPKGYEGYNQTFLTFKTPYEVGLREELQKLDRTSYLYKFEDTIILNLFPDDTLQHYVFRKWEKEGKIQELRVSIPVEWYEPNSYID